MILAAKLGALAAAGLLSTGGITAATCCPPPETISCLNGAVSFAQAKCSTQTLSDGRALETIQCPSTETAISGGWRLVDPLVATFSRPIYAAPLAPTNGHAVGYQYLFSSASQLTTWRVYATCQP